MDNKLYKLICIILVSSLPILYPCISHPQMEIRPEDPESYYQIGTTHFDRGDDNQAILYFNKALEIDPNYAKLTLVGPGFL